jgi:protein-glutamine gamma-glutamyltransferase
MSMGGYLQTMASQTDLVTGFSDTVNLGGIGKIQQSNNVVMHVQVLDGTLSADQKWRGVALSDFDGRRWSNSIHEVSVALPMHKSPIDLWLFRLNGFPLFSSLHRETLRYLVHMEPIGSHVFFLASTPIRVNGGYLKDVTVSANGSVTRSEDAGPIQVYEGEADQNDPAPLVRNSTSQDYPSAVREYLGLPPFLDPRIRALAADVTASAPSNYARARAIETYLSSNLGYTLDLPGEETDPLAHFLFERKKGHCEYFASSMAIMLRTLNIPARVVNGFRGGEYNDVNHTYIIRARDAHSWVEVYFPEYGWMTFDPTPSASAQADANVSSRLTLYLDALQEMWREWIINYDFSRQVRLGSQIGSSVSRLQLAVRFWYKKKYRRFQRQLLRPGAVGFGKVIIVAVLGMLLMVLPFAPRVLRAVRRARLLRNPQTAPGSAAGVWYLRMLKMMERRGIRKAPAQTAGEFASSIGDPEMQKSVLAFVQHYERARFAGSVEDALRLPQLYRELEARKTVTVDSAWAD